MSSTPRFFYPAQLQTGAAVVLPAGAARHVQVLRLQPGDTVTLFGGHAPGEYNASGNPPALDPGGEFEATIAEMGRHAVRVEVGRHHAVERESPCVVHLAIGMPANERMDWLVEKATELGVAAIQPLMTERSVVRLDDERARKKTAHWQSIAIAACEQCGRNRVPAILTVRSFPAWLRQHKGDDIGNGGGRFMLSLRTGAPLRRTMADQPLPGGPITVLSGPEGGLSASEESLAIALGFVPVSLGRRVLRSETAALVALTLLA